MNLHEKKTDAFRWKTFENVCDSITQEELDYYNVNGQNILLHKNVINNQKKNGTFMNPAGICVEQIDLMDKAAINLQLVYQNAYIIKKKEEQKIMKR